MSKVFFTNVQAIKANSLIDDNVSDKAITIMLRTAQDIYCQELLGTELYKKLINNISTNSLTVKQRYLIENYLLVYIFSLVELLSIDDLLIKYAENGIYTTTPANSTQRTKDELTSIKMHKSKAVNMYAGLVKTYITAIDNQKDFPEYYNLDTDGIKATKITTFGFFLDDDDFQKDDQYKNRNANNQQEESI